MAVFTATGGGTGGYDVGANTALEADVSADTASEAQGGGCCYGNGGCTGVHDSPSARMQRIGGPHTLDCLFIDSSWLC